MSQADVKLEEVFSPISESSIIPFPQPAKIPNLKVPLRIRFGVNSDSLPASVLNHADQESLLSEYILRANGEEMQSRGRKYLVAGLEVLGFSDAEKAVTEAGVSDQALFFDRSPV